MNDKELRKEIRRFAGVYPANVAHTCSPIHIANLLSDAKALILALAQEIDDRRGPLGEDDAPAFSEEFMGVVRAKMAKINEEAPQPIGEGK